MAFLQEPGSISRLCRQLPDHAAFDGLIVEINGAELVRNLNLAKEVASELRMHKIAISVDDLGAEWLSLTGLCNLPFVELKVDRKFVTGCAEDRLKQSICRRILDLAAGYGARTVAEGVETWADFLAAREMGLRSGTGLSVRQTDERAEFRADLLGRLAHLPSFAALLVRWGVDLRDRRPTAERSASCARRIPRGRSREMTTSRLSQARTRSKDSCTATSVSLSEASSVAKSGISAARASRSFSARGASSATNGLSRQSLSTWVRV
jgi:EAL domain